MAAPFRVQTISLGSQTLSASVFVAGRKGGGLTLEKFASRSLPGDPAAESARTTQTAFALEELAQSMDARIPARYALSGQSVFTRFVKLPPMGEGKVDQIVEFEAQQNVPFPISEVIWDYQLFTDAGSGETEVALLAIKADMLNQINDQVEDAGFRVETVDVAPMALLNAFRYNYPDLKDSCMLIDIGARTTNLVFSERGRVFARTLPIGGAAVTSAISKEFQVPFEAAEEKKCRDGFVALGGGYAEHADPALAAIGRVARSSMTRLHAEVVRTINYYRSTLGGNQPRQAMLCGGGSALPYTKEFFEEKLGIPVEYFNALRNIGVAAPIAEAAAAAAHRLGEHVGLALRATCACPMEIDLEPDAVALRREEKARRPLWTAAAVCLVAGTAALAAFGHFAKAKGQSRDRTQMADTSGLRVIANSMAGAFKEEASVDLERQPLLDALAQRAAWPTVLAKLNSYFASDVLWVTDIEPLKDGKESLLTDLMKDPKGRTKVARKPDTPTAPVAKGAKVAPAPAAKPSVTFVRVKGLWRSAHGNKDAGQDKVREIFDAIRADKESPFANEQMDQARDLQITGRNEDNLAWPFEAILPLKSPMPID